MLYDIDFYIKKYNDCGCNLEKFKDILKHEDKDDDIIKEIINEINKKKFLHFENFSDFHDRLADNTNSFSGSSNIIVKKVGKYIPNKNKIENILKLNKKEDINAEDVYDIVKENNNKFGDDFLEFSVPNSKSLSFPGLGIEDLKDIEISKSEDGILHIYVKKNLLEKVNDLDFLKKELEDFDNSVNNKNTLDFLNGINNRYSKATNIQQNSRIEEELKNHASGFRFRKKSKKEIELSRFR